VAQAAINMALGGDSTALKLVMDRVSPVRRGRPTPFRLPAITSLADLPQASLAVLQGVADGSLTPTEAAEIGRVLDAHARLTELSDIDQRVRALEQERAK
jgi:hypothetical protein